MSGTDILPFGAAVASEVLSAFQLPGGSVLTNLAEAYVDKKRREAANILIEEVSKGYHGPIAFEEHDVDPLIEIIFRFSKAVSDGAARENLRLLAQIIAGLKKKRAFDPDRFRRWCRVLEHLTRDELLTIGLAYRADVKTLPDGDKAADTFDQTLRLMLKEAGYSDEVEALLASVASAGLLSSASAFSGLAYSPTPWLKELCTLADFEAKSTR